MNGYFINFNMDNIITNSSMQNKVNLKCLVNNQYLEIFYFEKYLLYFVIRFLNQKYCFTLDPSIEWTICNIIGCFISLPSVSSFRTSINFSSTSENLLSLKIIWAKLPKNINIQHKNRIKYDDWWSFYSMNLLHICCLDWQLLDND